MRSPLTRWTVQVLATSALVALAVGRVDLEEAGAALGRANYIWAGAAVLLLSASKLLAAARWRLYLARLGRPPLLGLMAAYVTGTFLNTLLPFRAGDVAKIQIVASRYKLSRAGLTSSVFIVEGLLDLITLLGLLLLGLALLDVSFLPAAVLWPLVFLAGSAFAIILLVSRGLLRDLPDFLFPSFMPGGLRDGVREGWSAFIEGLAAFRSTASLAQAMSLHVVEWFMRAATLWLFGLSFALDVPASTFLVLTAALSVFTLLPLTFMNIGTYQVVASEVLSAAGAPRSEAFAYSITAQAVSHLWVSLMGLAALWALQLWPSKAEVGGRVGSDAEAGKMGPVGRADTGPKR